MENRALREFRQSSTELDNIYSAFIRSSGLSEPEYWSLVLIGDGINTQTKISEELCFSKQTLNSAFRLLIKKDLIMLKTRENNQRTKWATLTPKGQMFVSKQVAAMHRVEHIAWQTLDETDQQALARLTCAYTVALRKALGKRNEYGSSEAVQP